MDIVVAGLFSIAVFMAIFVPVSQRLLGVRFGLIRLVLGAALTLTVFSPIANALVGTLPFEGSNARRGRVPGVDGGLLDAVRPGLPGAVRGPGTDRIVAPGPRSPPGPDRPDRSHPALPADPPDRHQARPRPVLARPPSPGPRERRRPGRAGPLAAPRPRRSRCHVRQARPGPVHPQRHHPRLGRHRTQPPAGPGLPRPLAADRGSPHRGTRRTSPAVVRRLRHRTARGRLGRAGVHGPAARGAAGGGQGPASRHRRRRRPGSRHRPPARPAARAEHRLGPLDGRPRAGRRIRRRDARGARLHHRGRQHDRCRGRPIRCRQQ